MWPAMVYGKRAHTVLEIAASPISLGLSHAHTHFQPNGCHSCGEIMSKYLSDMCAFNTNTHRHLVKVCCCRHVLTHVVHVVLEEVAKICLVALKKEWHNCRECGGLLLFHFNCVCGHIEELWMNVWIVDFYDSFLNSQSSGISVIWNSLAPPRGLRQWTKRERDRACHSIIFLDKEYHDTVIIQTTTSQWICGALRKFKKMAVKIILYNIIFIIYSPYIIIHNVNLSKFIYILQLNIFYTIYKDKKCG